MGKQIEQTLSEYLLGLARGPWTKRYNLACLAMWRETYGDLVATRVAKIVRDRWAK